MYVVVKIGFWFNFQKWVGVEFLGELNFEGMALLGKTEAV